MHIDTNNLSLKKPSAELTEEALYFIIIELIVYIGLLI